jgi:choline-sulfatase
MPSLRRTAAAAALAVLACSPARRAAPRKVHDLLALFPVAEVHREVAAIDFGTPQARAHLASGWYPNEREADGTTFVWSRGEASVVEFFLAAPRDLRAEIRCEPLAVPGAPGPQSIALGLNGRPLARRELAPGMRGYAFDLPRAALRAGTNRLEIRYRNVSDPVRATGRRRLAVRFDALRFLPAGPPAAEPPRLEPGALYLPYGSGVVYYLDLPAGSALALDGLAERGGGEEDAAGGGRLAVAARTEAGERAERELAPGAGGRTVALPGRGERLVRLALRAAAGRAGAPGGLVLRSPAIVVAAGNRPVAVRPAVHQTVGRVPPRPWPPRPNVVVYLVDTLRADRLGCYGGAKPLSPNVDAFARGATLFERAVAQSTWTRPAVASLLTGLSPLAHGVETLDDRLPEAATTLPELLHAAGYRTAGWSTNPQVSAGTGLAQGFDDFEVFQKDPGSAEINRRVIAWLDRSGDRPGAGPPFFLYVHTLDPHAPYEPPPEMRRRFAAGIPPGAGSHAEVVEAYKARGPEREQRVEHLARLYDAEVAGNDRSFGELLAELRRRGLYDGALVVFVADHGEEFDEHGELGHGNDLYEPTLHVPFVVKWPGQAAGERVHALAQQVDLLPTLLAAAGLPRPAGLPGIDLFALRAAPAGDAAKHRAALSHLSYDGREGVSLVDGGWKLILPFTPRLGAGPELYRLDADPAERDDLALRDDVRAGWLVERIQGELRLAGTGHAAAGRAPVDEEARKALRALGYL